MKNHTPELVFYSRTYDEAIDVICRRSLVCCEPLLEPFQGFLFSSLADQVAVAIAVADEAEFEGNLIIASPTLRGKIESLIHQMAMEPRVRRVDLLGVWFWGDHDKKVLDEEFGVSA